MLIGLTGCESLVEEIDVPKIEPKPALYVFWDNLNGLAQGHATLSNPIFSDKVVNGFDTISDGMFIFISGTKRDTFYHLQNQYLGTVGSLVENNNYTVEFNSTKYHASATEKCPRKPTGIEVRYDSIVSQFDKQLNFYISWNDNADAEEYYVIDIYKINSGGEYFLDYGYTDDKLAKGGRCQKSLTVYDYYDDPFDKGQYRIVVSSVNKTYYKYRSMLYNYDPDFPFSEPSPLPGNFDNALGFFAILVGDEVYVE